MISKLTMKGDSAKFHLLHLMLPQIKLQISALRQAIFDDRINMDYQGYTSISTTQGTVLYLVWGDA
jgi:hypothetical protein